MVNFLHHIKVFSYVMYIAEFSAWAHLCREHLKNEIYNLM